MTVKTLTKAEWMAKGRELFGDDIMRWRFKCPVCGYVASVQDYKDAGARENEVAFNCIGRYVPGSRRAFGDTGPGPCDYTGGGLFPLNPVRIVTEDGEVLMRFDFAPQEGEDEPV